MLSKRLSGWRFSTRIISLSKFWKWCLSWLNTEIKHQPTLTFFFVSITNKKVGSSKSITKKYHVWPNKYKLVQCSSKTLKGPNINCFNNDNTTFSSYRIAHTVFEGFKELMGLPANKTPKRAEHDEIWAFFAQTHEKAENHQDHLKRPEKIFLKALYNFFSWSYISKSFLSETPNSNEY